MSGVVNSSNQTQQQPGSPKVTAGPEMSYAVRLNELLAQQIDNPQLISDVCSNLTCSEIISCVVTHVWNQGYRARNCNVRKATENCLLKHQGHIPFEDLCALCNAYRLNSLRREMSDFVEQAFALNKINLSETNSTLNFMRELGLDNVIEHELFDQLIAIERTQILSKSDSEKVEFLRAIGLCHANYIDEFAMVLRDLTPRLPKLSSRNMTRLLMGWGQVEHVNLEALNHVIKHVGDVNINYTYKERAIALKSLCMLADEKDVQQVWAKIEHIFTKHKLKNVATSCEILKAVSAVDLPIDQDRLQFITRKAFMRGTDWIDADVFNKLTEITSSIGYNHRMRCRIQTEMAEQTFKYNQRSYAIVVDYPWIHRFGGYDDGTLCGSEKMRDAILLRAGLTVIRIPEDLLFEHDTKTRLVEFIKSNPKPDTYFMTRSQ